MRPIRNFIVLPSLPPQLERLRALAYSLRWAWDNDTIELFRRLGCGTVGHFRSHPHARQPRSGQAGSTSEGRVGARAPRPDVTGADSLPRNQLRVVGRLKVASEALLLVAYFSAEFGVTKCLSVFAGGLGVLASDHLKSASDLGIPLVGVRLLSAGIFPAVSERRGDGSRSNTVRVLPFHAGSARGLPPGFIRWADVSAQAAPA